MISGMKNMSNKKIWNQHTPFIGDDDEEDNQLHDDFHYQTKDGHVFIDESYSKLTNITLKKKEWEAVQECLRFVFDTTSLHCDILNEIITELDNQLCNQKQRPWSC
jgi:hypothetical protein